MPDQGLLQRDATGLPTGAPVPLPWTISQARLVQVTFEVARSAALHLLPTETTRPVPCYARIIVLEAGDSPAGPFRHAGLFLGGRYQMLPKNVLVERIVEGPVDALAGALGGPARPGRIAIARAGDHVNVAVEAEEGELARVALPAPYAIEPSMLRWDPWLGHIALDGAVGLREVQLRVEATEAFLAKGATVVMAASLPRDHPWRTLRNLKTITACLVDGSLTLTEAATPPA
ncbi:MAG: hypothetical protein Kow0010_12270 [Dehalococcoidia bacterium]